MKKSVLVLITLISGLQIRATHSRSGEILYKRIAPFVSGVGSSTVPVYNYSITVIKYMDHNSLSIADRCMDTVYFGDGQKGTAIRINGGTTLNCGCSGTTACGQIISNQPGYIVKKSIYTITHTYSGTGTYFISSSDPNRTVGIHNIPNSSSVEFYLESQLVISANTNANTSPEFGNPPINQATAGICFKDSLLAFDADGDSLSYEVIACRGSYGATIPGYFFPEIPATGSFSMHPTAGILTWCFPLYVTTYNVAYKVSEWRKNGSGTYVLIGYVIRDREIKVNPGPLGIESYSNESEFLIYPMPVTAHLVVKSKSFTSQLLTVSIFDLGGREVYSKQIINPNEEVLLDLSMLNKGFYSLKIQGQEKTEYRKIIKE